MKNSEINYRGGLYYTSLLEQVRDLRKNQTPAEKIIWEILRNKKFFGYKFRRQHQIGYYIADFYCDELKLVIELDGEIHRKYKLYDKERDELFSSLGLKVIRFKNQVVVENSDLLVKTLIETISAHKPSP